MAGEAEEAIAYERDGARLMLEPEVETRPWAEQLAARRRGATAPSSPTCSSARAFYREKLGAAGIDSAEAAAGSRTSRGCR